MDDDKPDTVHCLRCMAFGAAIFIMALVLWAITTPARAQEPLTVRLKECKLPDCLMVNAEEFFAAVQRSNENFERATRAEEELEKLRAPRGPKCGVLEVVPPPKPLPPLKKERDS
jgi:hypothetical protein